PQPADCDSDEELALVEALAGCLLQKEGAKRYARAECARKLHAEGTAYSSLVEKIRLRDAIKLLDEPGLDIARIAELLGYSDAANFTRAFRKQASMTPSAYRATHR
ncbi:helix-turn-helix transcriptional regulator, partial [Alloalcanivorax venustensis]|uniref:helix-turn-helix transcriptional regulator n=1 Tax=Alloalcanivorax venustensis TaxID=172371 RepID=UPI003C586D25